MAARAGGRSDVDLSDYRGYVPKLGKKRVKVDLDTAHDIIRRTIEQRTAKDTDLMRTGKLLRRTAHCSCLTVVTVFSVSVVHAARWEPYTPSIQEGVSALVCYIYD